GNAWAGGVGRRERKTNAASERKQDESDGHRGHRSRNGGAPRDRCPAGARVNDLYVLANDGCIVHDSILRRFSRFLSARCGSGMDLESGLSSDERFDSLRVPPWNFAATEELVRRWACLLRQPRQHKKEC